MYLSGLDILILIILTSVPYIMLASLGTRSCRLLSASVVLVSANVVELTLLLIVATLNDPTAIFQWVVISALDFLNIVTWIVICLALNVRTREKAALHTARLIPNKKGSLPILVK